MSKEFSRLDYKSYSFFFLSSQFDVDIGKKESLAIGTICREMDSFFNEQSLTPTRETTLQSFLPEHERMFTVYIA